MCTPLECQAHFGQKGPQTERQSRRTAVFFVVALKVARGSPEGRRSALSEGPSYENGLQAKFGPKIEVVFSKNDTPLERKGRFTNPTIPGQNRP